MPKDKLYINDQNSHNLIRIPNVVIACEIRLYRDGLAHFLNKDSRLNIASVCASAKKLVTLLRNISADALLLDTNLPGSLDVVIDIFRLVPNCVVVTLGLSETEEEVLPYIERGVAGYVCKEGSIDDVVNTILCALNDELVCSPRISAALRRKLSQLTSTETQTPKLTRREQQIVSHLQYGLSNKEIASRLHISVSTVKNHVHNILEKLNVRSRFEAVLTLHNGFGESTAINARLQDLPETL